MKIRLFKLAVALTTFAAAYSAKSQGNLIVDGSFENSSSFSNGVGNVSAPWDTGSLFSLSPGLAGYNVTTVNAGIPSAAQQLSLSTVILPAQDGSTEAFLDGFLFETFQDVTLTANQTYDLSFSYYNGNTFSYIAEVSGPNGSPGFNANTPSLTEWTQTGYSFTPNATDTYKIVFYNEDSSQTFLDNVMLTAEPTPEPSTLALASLGAAALLALRRKLKK